MQDDSGLKGVLRIPALYNLLQFLVGGSAARRTIIHEHMRAPAGCKVVDIGCGPGTMLAWMPAVEYVGFDISEAYIESARKQYGPRGTFLVGSTLTLRDDPRVKEADFVVCYGLLHHLSDDEVVHLMEFARDSLKTGGRLVTCDPCWVPNQGAISKWVMNSDRGKSIRTEGGYRQLAEKVFARVEIQVVPGLIRIPSEGAILNCTK
jgi:SAM-dependent methyltransferase